MDQHLDSILPPNTITINIEIVTIPAHFGPTQGHFDDKDVSPFNTLAQYSSLSIFQSWIIATQALEVVETRSILCVITGLSSMSSLPI